MPTTKRKQLIVPELDDDIPPPSPKLLALARSVCEAAAELSKLRATIRLNEQEYRQAKTAAVAAQQRQDQAQGVMALAELVTEINSTRLALQRAEAQLCETQQLVSNSERNLAELDARHRTVAYELIAPFRTSAANRYRCAAEDLKSARNLYTDLGFVLGEADWHALRIVVRDLETSTDLLYEPNRPAPPLVVQYQTIRKALADGRRR